MNIQETIDAALPCPVCGYPLGGGIEEFDICPSCGTQFGYSDAVRPHADLRARWVARGAPWIGPPAFRPPGWSAVGQLVAAGHAADAAILRGMASKRADAVVRVFPGPEPEYIVNGAAVSVRSASLQFEPTLTMDAVGYRLAGV
jgi:hypothetical protein